MKEHLLCYQPLSSVSEHKLNTGHQSSMRNLKILDLEENWHRRKTKEAINIHRGKLSLNRDIGQELPPVMLQLVSHDVSHVTDHEIQSTEEGCERQPNYMEKTKKFLKR